jgi:predicted Rossmann fold flavoprotein
LVKIVVIGAGAAGFFGAITCAEIHPYARIILLEAGQQPLAKVRISGGGRCNVTHACFEPSELVLNYPRGGKALRGAFSRFHPRDTVKWFAKRGIKLKTEADGRMFPVTDNSETIVNCLVAAAQDAGVQLKTGTTVVSAIRSISADGEKEFEIKLKSGEILRCDRLLLATGSNPFGYQIAQALGHKIVSPVPSLFTFNIRDGRLAGLAGISTESANLRLLVGQNSPLTQTGALLITHWGLSGPAVLKLSAWGARLLAESRYQGTLIINWLPQFNPETCREKLLAVKADWGKKAIAANCPLALPRRLWQSIVTNMGIGAEDRWAAISNQLLNQLSQELTQAKFQIAGKGAFKEEFVTCGGVSLPEVNFKTMESRVCPGLYLAGEILDIDGVTGGFNFQSAWTTAWIAGNAIGKINIS